MGNKRKLPGGTIGWTGSTMRENQQEDIFLPCDDRLVAVNVGPDYHYGSLVYDTNQNNEFDADRSAWLQSAFRVLKRPLGGPNAIGFQLYFSGNGETKGGWFVDIGDGSSTKPNVATGSTASAGSGMVATGTVGSSNARIATGNAPVTYTTTNPGASGGVIIGQGSYNDGGPFHVGNKADKHVNGFDADGNPINSLHIDTGANFYKNQAEDGPLRFEDTYQSGQDAPVVVPVHLGWTGQDWAWWSTSYFYNPDPTPKPNPYPYPYPYPYGDPVPTPGPTPTPTPTPYNPNPNPYPWVPTGGTPTPGGPTWGPGVGNPGYVPVSTGGPVTPSWGGGGGGDPGGGNVPTGGDISQGGVTGGGTTGTGAGGTPQPGDVIGYTDDGIPIRQPPNPPGYNPQPPSPSPDGGGGGGGGGGQPPAPQPPTGPSTPHIPPDIPVYVLPNLPVVQDVIGSISTTGGTMNTIASTGAIVSQAMQFAAQNYGNGDTSGNLFNNPVASPSGSAAANKNSNSDPACGGMSSFAAQGGTTPSSPAPSPSPTPPSPSPAPSPTPSPAPASTGGGEGDPWDYTQAPRDTTDGSKQKSKYKRGTASGGICFHPSETDLRDIPAGLVPPNTSMSTTTVTVGPNAYFAAGVPELANGGIKSGYRWGVDSATGDLVFYSISFSQPPLEAVRFCNTGQVIRWRSTENVYGELSHANTGNQRYSFPDVTGYVGIISAVVADGGGTLVTNGHTGGSGPASAAIAKWIKIRASDGADYFIEGYQ